MFVGAWSWSALWRHRTPPRRRRLSRVETVEHLPERRHRCLGVVHGEPLRELGTGRQADLVETFDELFQRNSGGDEVGVAAQFGGDISEQRDVNFGDLVSAEVVL